jgi:LytTr DNA-binding domain
MSGTRQARRKLGEPERLAARAWERFAGGEDVVQGVRPEILSSWLRCRDEYGVDPGSRRAPASERGATLAPYESIVAAELGAAAMSISVDVGAAGGVVSVADGMGRVLSTWGDESAERRSGEQNLQPFASWNEFSAGTTGIGTALASHREVTVSRYEHWCAAFHDWSCAAVAIVAPETAAPVGVIGISMWDRPVPDGAISWLRGAARGVERRLSSRGDAALALPAPRGSRPAPGRLVGVRDGRMLLVDRSDVRAVFADRGLVWLDTVDGRLRAAAKGIGELEERLAGDGFMCVSRGTLVNLAHVREIATGFNGGLWLLLDDRSEPVQVARRRVPALRAALGL